VPATPLCRKVVSCRPVIISCCMSGDEGSAIIQNRDLVQSSPGGQGKRFECECTGLDACVFNGVHPQQILHECNQISPLI
jgi:hypothetical protein